MSSDDLREKGIAAAKARRTDEARQFLLQAIKANPQDEIAWLYLASVTADKKERLVCLQKVLEINPDSELGRKAVQAMGIDPEQLLALSKNKKKADTPPPVPPVPTPFVTAPQDEDDDIDISASPYDDDDVDINTSPYDDDDDVDISDSPYDNFSDSETYDESPYDNYAPEINTGARLTDDFDQDDDQPYTDDFSQEGAGVPVTNALYPPQKDQTTPGIPMPDFAYLESALLRAEQVAERYIQPLPDDISWTQKTKRRAGEGDLARLRLQIYGTAAAVLAFIIIGGGVFLATNPEAQRVVLNLRTATPTPTATFTPTNTPGLTETPTATIDFTANPTFTPSPTINPTFTPLSVLDIRTPRPTEPYLPGRLEGNVISALGTLNAGNASDPVATMEFERQLVSNRFDPNPYYVSALALAADGQLPRAFEIMEEAEERLQNISGSDGPIFKAVVDLGFAELHLRSALINLENGSRSVAQVDLAQVIERANDTLEFDPRYSRAHVLIAQAQALNNDFTAALETLTLARQIPGLADDNAIVTELSAVNLQLGRDLLSRGDPDGARAAFQEASYQATVAIYLNPYEERAHQLRIESALAEGKPGDAVLFTQTYRIAFPNSAQAFRLLGTARVAEGNTDLALEAYTSALELGEESPALVDILLSRGDLYLRQSRYEQAMADYNRAFETRPIPSIRALRLQAAYLVGDFDTAETDARALLGLNIIPDNELRLIEARVAVDRAVANGTRQGIQQAFDLLNSISVDGALAPVRQEYLARSAFLLEDFNTARISIEAALQTQETGGRRFLSGQINEALGTGDSLSSAIRDYEWVLAWDTVYNFGYAPTAQARIPIISTQIFETAVAETAIAVTATAEAELTLTLTPEN